MKGPLCPCLGPEEITQTCILRTVRWDLSDLSENINGNVEGKREIGKWVSWEWQEKLGLRKQK